MTFGSYAKKKRFQKTLRDALKRKIARGESFTKEDVLLKALQDRQGMNKPSDVGSESVRVLSTSTHMSQTLPVQTFYKLNQTTPTPASEPIGIFVPDTPDYQKKKPGLITCITVPETPVTRSNSVTNESAPKIVKRILFPVKHPKPVKSQDRPEWLKKWLKPQPTATPEPDPEVLSAQLRDALKQLNQMAVRYRDVVMRNCHLEQHYNWHVSAKLKMCVTPYAYEQARASMEQTAALLSKPDTDLNTANIPLIEVHFDVTTKLPVPSTHFITSGHFDDEDVILKKHDHIYHVMSEFSVLTQLKSKCVTGVPEACGIFYKNNILFLVMKEIPSRYKYVTLSDLLHPSHFGEFNYHYWANFLVQLWTRIDEMHSAGYIHNKIIPSNILLSVSESDENPTIYLVGLSLSSSCSLATSLQAKITPTLRKVFSHFPSDIREGKAAPSFQSDVYCYGNILCSLALKSLNTDNLDDHASSFWLRVQKLGRIAVNSNFRDIPYGPNMTALVNSNIKVDF